MAKPGKRKSKAKQRRAAKPPAAAARFPGAQKPPDHHAAKQFTRETLDKVLDKVVQPKPQPGQVTPKARSLLEAVRDLMRYHPRRTFLKALCEQYNCSPRTVDRAIAVVWDEWDAFQSQDSKRRIAQGYQRYISLAERAEDDGKYTAARGALDSAHTLVGDRRPDVVLLASADMPSEKLQAEAQRLAELAARRLNKK